VPARGHDGRVTGDVCVLGSANMDLVVRAAAFPAPGETVTGASFVTVPGGKGLNQAVAAARAGAPTRFVGAVGADGFGGEIRALLEREGIDVAALAEGEVTGTAHIVVADDGENAIVVVPGANHQVRAEQLSDAVLGEVSWLVTQLEVRLDVVQAALVRAASAGVRTVLTPAPVQALDAATLGAVDLLVPNQIEACRLAGAADPLRAAERLSETCRDVVVTLGARGAVWARGGRIAAQLPGRRVEAVDTTAAGDTFVGALVALLAEGADMPVALDRAGVAASIAVTRPGASSSMPTRAEIDAVA